MLGVGRDRAGRHLLLANRECPWRCLMCDLWKNTFAETVARRIYPAHRLTYALERLPPARQIKLYNSGSFFDPGPYRRRITRPSVTA